jgi:DNA-binding NtrC family response regulator
MIPLYQSHAANRRVLIVEDDRRMREMLERALAPMEFPPSSVSTAEEALNRLDREEFGIVIADLNLPRMHGLDFCEQLRHCAPLTQIIVLTGYGDLNAAQRAIRIEVADFLTKPCPLGQLEAALDRALRRRIHRGVEAIHPLAAISFDEGGPNPQAPKSLRDFERQRILETLVRHDGNRSATADELGISIRTLYYRLKEYQREQGGEE